MKKLLSSLLLVLSFTSLGQSQVTTTLEMSDVFKTVDMLGEKYGQQNTLVVFDIDDTLLVIEHCQRPDGSWTRGIGKLFHCPSEHTEDILANELRRIQESGYSTIALTARGASLIKPTKRELARRHFRKKTLIFKGKPYLKEFNSVSVPRTRRCKADEIPPCLKGEDSDKPKFLEGVMYANGTHKGLALKRLLEELGDTYSAIVFIDDRKKNTDDVHEVYKNQGSVEVHNFLYLRHRD